MLAKIYTKFDRNIILFKKCYRTQCIVCFGPGEVIELRQQQGDQLAGSNVVIS